MSSVAGGIDGLEAVFDDGSLVADAGLLLAGTVRAHRVSRLPPFGGVTARCDGLRRRASRGGSAGAVRRGVASTGLEVQQPRRFCGGVDGSTDGVRNSWVWRVHQKGWGMPAAAGSTMGLWCLMRAAHGHVAGGRDETVASQRGGGAARCCLWGCWWRRRRRAVGRF